MLQVVSTVEARAVAAADAAAGTDSVTHNSMVNGSDHNVLPMTSSHNMRRAQSPTSSGFIKVITLPSCIALGLVAGCKVFGF